MSQDCKQLNCNFRGKLCGICVHDKFASYKAVSLYNSSDRPDPNPTNEPHTCATCHYGLPGLQLYYCESTHRNGYNVDSEMHRPDDTCDHWTTKR